MLYDQIKKANVQAMKDKDSVARSFYSVLLNKIMLENIKKNNDKYLETIITSPIPLLIEKNICIHEWDINIIDIFI